VCISQYNNNNIYDIRRYTSGGNGDRVDGGEAHVAQKIIIITLYINIVMLDEMHKSTPSRRVTGGATGVTIL